jgi:hypothetical protein
MLRSLDLHEKHLHPCAGCALNPNSEDGIGNERQPGVAQTFLSAGSRDMPVPSARKLATGKSPEPVGWKACATTSFASPASEFRLIFTVAADGHPSAPGMFQSVPNRRLRGRGHCSVVVRPPKWRWRPSSSRLTRRDSWQVHQSCWKTDLSDPESPRCAALLMTLETHIAPLWNEPWLRCPFRCIVSAATA